MRLSIAFSSFTLGVVASIALMAADETKPARPGFPPPPFGAKPPAKPPIPGLPEAAPNLPELAGLLKQLGSSNDADRVDAISRLQEMGRGASGAIDALKRSASDTNPHVRFATLETLGDLQADGKSAAGEVRQRIEQSTSEYERVLAAATLLRISRSEADVAMALPILAKGLRSEDEQTASRAAEGLAEAGRISEATLIAAMQESSPLIRGLTIDALGQIGARGAVGVVAQQLADKDAAIRAVAARALGQVGPAAKTAEQALVAALTDSDATVRVQTATALGQIDSRSPEVIRSLAKAANSEDEALARTAVRSLAELKIDSKQWIPFLSKLLVEGKPSVIPQAMSALADQGEAAVPAMIEALKDPRSQLAAALVLAEIGPAAKTAVDGLAAALDSASAEVRVEILLTLAKLGPDASAALPKIAAQLEDKQEGVRYAATFAAVSIGAKDAAVEAALQKNANSTDQFLVMLSNWALAILNPQDPTAGVKALQSVVAALGSRDVHVQQAATKALEKLNIGPAAIPQLLPRLAAAFQSSDPTVRNNAVDSLAAIAENSPATPVLRGLLESDPLRALGLQVANKLGPKAQPAVPAIVALLNSDKRSEIRRDAAFALAAVGSGATSAVPSLVSLLSDSDREVRRAAIFALGKIGSAAASAGDALASMLDNSDEEDATLIAWAVAQTSPNEPGLAAKAIPHLIRSLGSERADDRIAAAGALGNLGPAAAATIPALNDAELDSNRLVRIAATDAIKRIGKAK